MRSLMELEGYLKNEFEESLEYCALCQEISLNQSIRCTSSGCQTVLHHHCATKYSKSRPEIKCMGCQAPWKLKDEDS